MERATNSSPEERRLYSQKDANAILEQAIGADGKNFTDENLEEMAKELGISAAQLEAAKEVWFNQQQKQIELEKTKTQRWLIAMSGIALMVGVVLVAIILYALYIVEPELFSLLSFIIIIVILFILIGVAATLSEVVNSK